MITQEEVKRLFRYDEVTGQLFWKVDYYKGRVGGEVGNSFTAGRNTYRTVFYKGTRYLSHRIIWLFVYGEFPEHVIDHIDGNGLNNRLSNLRSVTQQENLKNKRRRIDNTSGEHCVTWNTNRNKWQIYIQVNRKPKYIGIFKTLPMAVIARDKALQKYCPCEYTERHGLIGL